MKPFLFVFLSADPIRHPAKDKYGKKCRRTVWKCGDASFALLSRYDCGRLIQGTHTLLKACGCGCSTVQGRYAHFPDTPRSRALLTKHGVTFHPCADYAEADTLEP